MDDATIAPADARDGHGHSELGESIDDENFVDEEPIVSGNGDYEMVNGRHSPNDDRRFRRMRALNQAMALAVVLLVGYIAFDQWNTDDDDGNKPPLRTGGDSDTDSPSNSLTLPWKELPVNQTVLTSIAFGSCINQLLPQPHWDTIQTYNPDMLLLMGDNVYGDCESESCPELEQAYRQFLDHPSVQGVAGRLPIYATLDDHDYGQNNANGDNPHKDYAKTLFRQVFGIEEELDDGVYRSRTWGLPGNRLQVILLDTRYARSPFLPYTDGRNAPFHPVPSNDTTTPQQMLSERQWLWLEEQLGEPADLRVIVSSVQVLNDVTGYECWRHLPRERQRLYNLLEKYNSSNILLLSGDRHMGGFYETQDGAIREITASSFTHSYPLSKRGADCTPETCSEADPSRVGPEIHENHWGSIDIDWNSRTAQVSLRQSDTSYGAAYLKNWTGDAGSILMSKSYHF